MIPRGTLHVLRTKFLWQGVCYERFEVVNYGANPVDIPLEFVSPPILPISLKCGASRVRGGVSCWTT